MGKFSRLLLAAAAAFGVYKYSKMTPEEKTRLKSRGKSFLDKNLKDVKSMFGEKTNDTAPNNF